jgi:hypothetical protein
MKVVEKITSSLCTLTLIGVGSIAGWHLRGSYDATLAPILQTQSTINNALSPLNHIFGNGKK